MPKHSLQEQKYRFKDWMIGRAVSLGLDYNDPKVKQFILDVFNELEDNNLFTDNIENFENR